MFSSGSQNIGLVACSQAFERVKQTRKHPSVFHVRRFMKLVGVYTHTRARTHTHGPALYDVLFIAVSVREGLRHLT